VFPGSRADDEGRICKICDTKFFIKKMLKEKQDVIEMQNQQLAGDMGLKS